MTTRRGVLVALLGLVAVAGGVTHAWRSGLWARLWIRHLGLLTPFANEEHWLVHEVVADVGEMGGFGARHQGSAKIVVALEATAPGQFAAARVTIELGGVRLAHAIPRADPFDPVVFEPLVADWIRTLGRVPRARKRTEPGLPWLLTDFRAEVLDDINRRVSSQLADEMLDPQAHEEAALVVGTFALREEAGRFQDLRGILCRLTAHLAMARGLGSGQLSATGRLADAVRLTLLGRARDAVAVLDVLRAGPDEPAGTHAFTRALTVWNTEDYRPLPAPNDITLLEQVAIFRALQRARGTAFAWSWIEKAQRVPEISSWTRLGLDSEGSLAAAHRLFPAFLEREVSELDFIYRREYGRTLEQLSGALGEAPERCITRSGRPRALSFGTWAASAERHLCEYLNRADRHTRSLGLTEADTLKERLELDTLLRGTRLFPFAVVWRERLSQVDEDDPFQATILAILTDPERINPLNWASTFELAPYERLVAPDPARWFSRALLRETALDTWMRRNALPPSEQEWDAILALDPWNFGVRQMWLTGTGRERRLSVAELLTLFGDRTAYDLRPLAFIADTATPDSDDELSMRRRLCELGPEHCLDLGAMLLDRMDRAGASAAFERAFTEAIDRVAVANQVDWLVNHHYDNGNVQRALEIAAHGAEVYSASGLGTQARLAERMGRLDEAERAMLAIEQRYEQSERLLGFYFRMARVRGRQDYEVRFEQAAAKVFAGGLRRIDAQSRSSAPREGVVVLTSTPRARAAGFRAGDLIVGANGWRVTSLREYRAVLELERSRSVVATVWRGGRYEEVSYGLRYWRETLPLGDYPNPPAS